MSNDRSKRLTATAELMLEPEGIEGSYFESTVSYEVAVTGTVTELDDHELSTDIESVDGLPSDQDPKALRWANMERLYLALESQFEKEKGRAQREAGEQLEQYHADAEHFLKSTHEAVRQLRERIAATISKKDPWSAHYQLTDVLNQLLHLEKHAERILEEEPA